MELNARTTMSHYALAAQRRIPTAWRFEVALLSELPTLRQRAQERGNRLVCLTDPQVAKMFCAVVECRPESARLSSDAAMQII